jgi:hypothetical protein
VCPAMITGVRPNNDYKLLLGVMNSNYKSQINDNKNTYNSIYLRHTTTAENISTE